MIAFNDITKKYQEKIVLDNVSLNLPENKLICFVGSNGAGKSTLISIISRILDRDAGSITVDDTLIENWNKNELSKKLSILRQSNFVNLRITVRELICFGRFPYTHGRLNKTCEEKVNDAIRYMNLEKFEDRYLDELSGGERQMAFIAMVIAQDTKYILLDEPLNNLDMHHSSKIMKILKNLVEEKNKTVIVVIHDINFVSNYADYVVALKDGKIIRHGDVEEIINQESLSDIYNIDIKVIDVEGKKICLYYQ